MTEGRERLRAAGFTSPSRTVALMRAAIDRLELDLRGATVLTEAGSGVFALTPVIAAMAGADVRALTRASQWGSVESIRETVDAASRLAGIPDRILVTTDRHAAFVDVQIVTNLGFVRPIDGPSIRHLARGAVVALMCEAWELRPGDLDLGACQASDVLVLGTNEHDSLCDVFRFAGPLAGLLLLDAGFELLGVRVAVVGRDAFAPAISSWLTAAGSRVTQCATDRPIHLEALAGTDVVLVSDYATDDLVVGPGGLIDPGELSRVAPNATVVQFAGRIERDAILRHGFGCWPDAPVESRRMVRTFSALGPAPVIALHAGGLKVGEIGWRARRGGCPAGEAEATAIQQSRLVQRVRMPVEGTT